MTDSPHRATSGGRPRRAARIVCWLITALGLACQSQNGSDSPMRDSTAVPQASFSQSATAGTPGMTVQFTDTSTGGIDEYEWDFGPLGKRSETNPVVTFVDVGVYSVELRVTGDRGSSTASKPALIEIAEMPVAGASCTPTSGFAPLTIVCTDTSQGATSLSWEFSDGTVSSATNPTHTFSAPGPYTVVQRATTAAGDDTVTIPVEAYSLSIAASSASPSAPGDIEFSLVTSAPVTGFVQWTVDGVLAANADSVTVRLGQPGTYAIAADFLSLMPPLAGTATLDFVVEFAEAQAAFAPDVSGGSGPLEVVFEDRSLGAVDSWAWDFGDGSDCVFPAPAVPDPIDPETVCDASSPTHVYAAIGGYDVSLTVSGPASDPNDPPVVSSVQQTDAVRVHILDASFEDQATNGPIEGAWTSLRPANETVVAEHLAFAVAGGADAGMPSDGSKWAVLEGLGTDGSTPVDTIDNGIEQEFILPLNQPVIEIDYAFLYSEPPASPVQDAFTATVSLGATSFELDGARAEVSSPYAGGSSRFATRDGSPVRATPRRTASLDVEAAFGTLPPDTRFTLTLRVTNATNTLRSPIAYVDAIRFSERASSLTSQFLLQTDPVVAGEDAFFLDESCPDPTAGTCVVPTSWRWDFDTQFSPTAPESSGSGDQNPVYVFPEPGVYQVRQLVRLGQLDDESVLSVTVIGGPTAEFEVDQIQPGVAPDPLATVSFNNLSDEDPADPIDTWSWDFGGWGASSDEDPAPVAIGQAGDWLISLTVTTVSGKTDTAELTVTIQ